MPFAANAVAIFANKGPLPWTMICFPFCSSGGTGRPVCRQAGALDLKYNECSLFMQSLVYPETTFILVLHQI